MRAFEGCNKNCSGSMITVGTPASRAGLVNSSSCCVRNGSWCRSYMRWKTNAACCLTTVMREN